MRQSRETLGYRGRKQQVMAEAGAHSPGNTEEPSVASAKSIGEEKGRATLLPMEVLGYIQNRPTKVRSLSPTSPDVADLVPSQSPPTSVSLLV